MNREVFLSLLALDSYNRGYGENVGNLGGVGSFIGNAKLAADALTELPIGVAQAAGFYAIAYEWQGETIISYRGTDYPPDGTFNDIFTGWTLGAGFPQFASQADLAIEFYEAVAGVDSIYGTGGSAVFTGHSLGGGLAGFVAALVNAEALAFDRMPFVRAAYQQALTVSYNGALEASAEVYGADVSIGDIRNWIEDFGEGQEVDDDELTDSEKLQRDAYFAFIDTFVDNLNLFSPELANISGIHVDGEILEFVRSGNAEILASSILSTLSALEPTSLNNALAAYGFGAGQQTNVAESLIPDSEVPNFGIDLSNDLDGALGVVDNLAGITNAIGLHSQNLQTILLFGLRQWEPSEGGSDHWQEVIKFIAPSLLQENLGRTFGLVERGTGLGSANGQLTSMIAYSLLDGSELVDGGQLVFGDTAIRALFDDADDVGRVLRRNPDVLGEEALENLSGVIAEFAGLLAANKIEHAEYADARSGIVGGDELDNWLTVDVSQETWGQYDVIGSASGVNRGRGDFQSGQAAIFVEELIDQYIGTNASPDEEADEQRSAFDNWLREYSVSIEPSRPGYIGIIDNVILNLGRTNTVQAANADGRYDGYQLVIVDDRSAADPNTASENATYDLSPGIIVSGDGGNELAGAGGDDAFITGSGDDELWGHDGNDFFSAGRGANIIRGGEGYDTVFFAQSAGDLRIEVSDDQIDVRGSDQAATLYDVEEIEAESGQVTLDLTNGIANGTQLTVNIGDTGQSQIIRAKDALRGFTMFIDPETRSVVRDVVTDGAIVISGFNTDIIGSNFDDTITDRSDESKVISAGGGNDFISVATTDAEAIIFGGNGVNQIFGSDAGDFIVNQSNQDMFTRATPAFTDVGEAVRRHYGAIEAGAGDDVIIIGSDVALTRFSGRTTYGPIGSGFFINGGEGDDEIHLTNSDASYYIEHDLNGGNDEVFFDSQNGRANRIAFDLRDFDSSSIIATFSYSSFEVDSIVDGRPTDVFAGARGVVTLSGDLTLTIAGGGSIRLRDQFFTTAVTFGAGGTIGEFDGAEILSGPNAQFTSTPWVIESANNGAIEVSFSAPAFAARQSAQTVQSVGTSQAALTSFDGATTANATTETALVVDQDAFLASGDHTLTGGNGLDQLIVTWDLNALTSTLSGDQIVIEDRWGLIGSTTLIAFDQIFDVTSDTVYTPEEFHAELQSRQQGETLTGNSENNVLVGTERRDRLNGGAGDDELRGLAGDDNLNGGAGADALIGGRGDDVYVVNDIGDTVVELAGEGTDKVESFVNWTLSDNVEELILRGSTAETATGNALDNRITGGFFDNVLSGLDGDDWLDGSFGNDQLVGGNGDDVLVGGVGDDTLIGGDGNDTYVIDVSTDILIEQVDQGIDTVNAAFDYTLTNNFENLVLSGGALLGTGNSSDNRIIGNDEANVLSGMDGADTIDGRDGNDEIFGGAGSDTLNGGLGNDLLSGDDGDDTLSGGEGDDELEGGEGSDVLVGGSGGDFLLGGAGNDTIYGDVNRGFSADSSELPANDPVDPNSPIGPGDPVGPIDPNFSSFDELDGGAGDDILFAGAIDTELYGGEGNDLLFGGIGNDVFSDEGGNDLYVGDGVTSLAGIGLEVARLSDPSLTEDSLFFEGRISDFQIQALGNDWFRVEHLNGSQDVDYVVNMTDLIFEDASGEDILLLDAPSATADNISFSYQEEQELTFAISEDWFGDANGNPISYSITGVGGVVALSSVSITNGIVSLGVISDFAGSIEVELTATSLTGATTKAVELNVANVNDAPIAAGQIDDQFAVAGGAFSINLGDRLFLDVDNDPLTLTATLANGDPLPDWLSYDGTTLAGTPPEGFSFVQPLQVVISASDGEFNESIGFDFFIASAPNQAPEVFNPIEDQSFLEDTFVNFSVPIDSFSDPDGDALTLSATLADGSELPVWLTFDGTTLSGTPPQDFNGALDVAITANDGLESVSSIFTLTIDPVNDAPTLLQAISDIAAVGGGDVTLDLNAGVFADVDGDALSFSAALSDGSALPNWLTLNNGVLSGADIPNAAANLEITITASDGAASVSDTFTLDVTLNNGPPEANDDGVFVGLQAQELLILASDLLINDIDPDGDALSIVSVTGTGNGTVSLDADGNVIYSVDSTFTGSDSFIYTLSDGNQIASASVAVRIDSLFEGWSEGSSGDDRLFGNNKEQNALNGLDGDDRVKGGKLADQLAGGAGNDKIQGLNGDDHLWGNSGDDELLGNGGFDTAYYFGLRSSYLIQTINGTVQVVDTQPGVDGDDGTDTISSIELLSFKNGETASVVSPIVLDLAGDGVQTINAAQSDARFDLDSDGLADDTSWIGANDAFLYLDRNADGTLSGVEEISFVDDVENAATDLEGLAAFDSNGDGVLNADDERFDEFGVWNDADGDGAVDEGETASLVQVGIASIDLTGTPIDGVTEFGEVAIANTGSFTLVNGATREFADAALTYFSAATNLPELQTASYDFGRKASKYRVHVANGVVSVGRKNRSPALDPNAGQLGANTVLTFKGQDYGRFAPVALDLDGDGIEMVRRKKSNAAFDYGGDGTRDDTGWISGDDGFLVIDRNNDGLITEASELSLASEDEDARTGLQGLARLDANADGVVDADDARFGELRVWQDRNGNGRTDAGELRTLEEAGIVSLSLAITGVAQNRVKLGKNVLTATSSFTRSDGTTSTAGDVSLAYRPAGSSAVASSLSFTAASLSAFNQPWLLDQAALQNGIPTRDDIFDLIRSGNEIGLADVFNQLGNNSVGANVNSVPVAVSASMSDGTASSAPRTLQVLPTTMASMTSLLDDSVLPRVDAGEVYVGSTGGQFALPVMMLRFEDEQSEPIIESSAVSRTTQEQPTLLAVLEEGDGASNGAADSDDKADIARKIAIIRQDLAVFGAGEGVNDLEKRYDDRQALDYFAA